MYTYLTLNVHAAALQTACVFWLQGGTAGPLGYLSLLQKVRTAAIALQGLWYKQVRHQWQLLLNQQQCQQRQQQQFQRNQSLLLRAPVAAKALQTLDLHNNSKLMTGLGRGVKGLPQSKQLQVGEQPEVV